MIEVSEYLRIDYGRNAEEGVGPIPPGSGRGHWFEPEMFWPMDDFLTPKGLDFLRRRTEELLANSGVRKDFDMPQSSGTPRHMRVVPGTVIKQDPEIRELYSSPELLKFISEIVGDQVEIYPDDLENIVITSLEGPGDTHGKHLDVPPVALIICTEAPALDQPTKALHVKDVDGEVWMSIVGTDRPDGMLAFENVYGDPQLHAMMPGDAYLLRTDEIPHEVLPLGKEGQVRRIINFTYGMAGMAYKEDGSAQELFA